MTTRTRQLLVAIAAVALALLVVALIIRPGGGPGASSSPSLPSPSPSPSASVSVSATPSSAPSAAASGSPVANSPAASTPPASAAPTAPGVATPAPAATPSSPTVRWVGTWKNTTPDDASGTLEMTWVQTATDLDGTLTMTDHACFTEGTLQGTLVGNALAFRVVGRDQVAFIGTIAGDTVSGSYTLSCDGSTGTWTAKRVG